MDGVVFAVHGEEFLAGLCGGGHDQFTGGDEDFFVGEGHSAAELDCFVGGFEADDTDGGGEDDFGGGMSANGEHAFTAVMDGGERRKICFAKAAGEFAGELFIGYGNYFGMVAQDLREEFVEIGAGGEGHDFELIGEGFDDGNCLAADGAGRAEDGKGFHG